MSSTGIVLYGDDLSNCVRTVRLVLKILNLDYEFKDINLRKREQLGEWFVKKNPLHTVPTLEDNGIYIWESHAIVTYLVDKYGKSDELYPKDVTKRAMVDQMLYFDASVIFANLASVSKMFWLNGITVIPQEKLDTNHRGLQLLETVLESSKYLVGDTLTLADLCTGPTVSSLPAIIDIDPKVYPKVTAWLARLNEIPHYKEINEAWAQEYISILRSKWTKLGDQ